MTLSSSRRTYSLVKTKKALTNMLSEKASATETLAGISSEKAIDHMLDHLLAKNAALTIENDRLEMLLDRRCDSDENLKRIFKRILVALEIEEQDESSHNWFEVADLIEKSLKEYKAERKLLREFTEDAEKYRNAFERAAGFIASNAQEYLGCDSQISLQEGMEATKKALQELEVLRELKLSGDIS